jgi:hypothetical protein
MNILFWKRKRSLLDVPGLSEWHLGDQVFTPFGAIQTFAGVTDNNEIVLKHNGLLHAYPLSSWGEFGPNNINYDVRAHTGRLLRNSNKALNSLKASKLNRQLYGTK